MKLKYLGCMQQKQSGGCRSCGGSRFSYTLERARRFTMINGEIREFIAGETYEVSIEEASYLLKHTCADKTVFEVVS